jgi:hypothetical protein
MTNKEFTMWLKGFLHGKQKLNSDEISELNKIIETITDEPKQQFPFGTPNTIPSHPIPRHIPNPHNPIGPMNPTCNTAKELLNNGVYGPGDDNYGRDKKQLNKYWDMNTR